MKNSKEYNNNWYAKNKERIGADKVKQARARNRRNMQYLVDFLRKNPCIDCGETDFKVLDLDHVRGEKNQNVCDMVRKGFSINKIQEEIDKCEVRCSNCHRRKTAIQLGWYKDII
jgi:hypothetical protein